MHRAIWAIALPAMLTNVATALFGLADMWVIGQLGDAQAQAGVEVGAKFMMGLLLIFNFLRNGTIALTAQAAGRGDDEAQAATLVRAAGAALFIALILFALMPLAIRFGLDLLQARGGVAAEAETYVGIRYWGAVLWLVNAAITGWLIGRKRVRSVLVIEVGANLIHVALDVLFVLGFGWGVAGVATATLLSEGGKLLAAAFAASRETPARLTPHLVRQAKTWRRETLAVLFRLNRDLFLRTLLLTLAILLVTRDGAMEGAVILAANGIIYQLFILSALILDGFEAAAQVLCGEAVGARRRDRFARLVHASLGWGFAGGLLITGVYAIAGAPFASSFSTDSEVASTALTYLPWAILLPVAGALSYVFDGIYIGATWTRPLLGTMIAAFSIYALLLIVTDTLGNHGLWLAFSLFFVARAAAQALLLPRLQERTFATSPVPAAVQSVPHRP